MRWALTFGFGETDERGMAGGGAGEVEIQRGLCPDVDTALCCGILA